MADQFAVAAADSPASPGTFDITSGSITETVKAALFIYSHSITNAATTDSGCLGLAAWANDGDTGTENLACMFTRGLQSGAIATADVRTYQNASTIGTIELDANPLIDFSVDSVTAISGGVRLNATTTTSRSKITAVLFAGVARAYVSRVTSNTTLAHEDAGSVSTFRPDALIVFGSDGGFSGTPKDDFTAGIGFVLDGGAHAGAHVNIDRGTDPAEPTSRVDGTTIPFIVQGTGALQGVTFTIDATGYNHQLTVGAGSPDMVVMALQFTDDLPTAVDNLTVTSSSSQSFNIGVQPQLVIGMSTLLTTENTTTTDTTAATAGLFAFTAAAARAYTGGHDASTTIPPANSKSRQDDKALLTLDHAGTVAQEATATMTSVGFDLSLSTATAGLLTVLAIGQADQAVVVSETENITENVVAFLNATLVVPSDTVQISESVQLGTFDVTTSDGPQGTTFDAHSERGTALQGGAEAGTVF